MKKVLIIALILIVLATGIRRLTVTKGKKTIQLNPTITLTQPAKEKVSVSIDFGDGKIATYSATQAQTALGALEEVTKNNKLTLVVKEFSFGKLVQKIDNRENTKELAWIYFVNGKSGNVGADQYKMSNGDKIEWKYVKPNY